ncbi:MAG: 1-deoxy-D-xylulose-5-phosphate reductoisomerase [Brevinematia bacterium]
MERIALFGSTGSIGKKVLEVVRMFPDEFKIEVLGARKNIKELINQCKEFSPSKVYIHETTLDIESNFSIPVLSKYEGIKEICESKEIDTVIIAVDGYFGLIPTIEALKNNKKVLTANKESIFIWGYQINEIAKKTNSIIIPIDSEHNTIFNLTNRIGKENIEELIITASGGPLLTKTQKEIDNTTIEEILSHPNWSMGKIVTFNSATMFNKFLEVFEAHIFFEIDIEKIRIIIHPESRIHSMVLLKDGTIWSIYYYPDMIFPIANAMFFPRTPDLKQKVKYEIPLNTTLRFLDINYQQFRILELLKDIKHSSTYQRAVLNTANEICITFFEKGKIKFSQIPEILKDCYYNFNQEIDLSNLEKAIENMEKLKISLEEYIKIKFNLPST